LKLCREIARENKHFTGFTAGRLGKEPATVQKKKVVHPINNNTRRKRRWVSGRKKGTETGKGELRTQKRGEGAQMDRKDSKQAAHGTLKIEKRRTIVKNRLRWMLGKPRRDLGTRAEN